MRNKRMYFSSRQEIGLGADTTGFVRKLLNAWCVFRSALFGIPEGFVQLELRIVRESDNAYITFITNRPERDAMNALELLRKSENESARP